MVQLTHKEEEIMRILWRLEKAFVKEIIAEMPKPRPPYSTVSSVVRKLESMGCVAYEAFGKNHRYYPVLKKEEYKKSFLRDVLDNYFGGSVGQLMSFFAKQEEVDVDELNGILDKIKNQKKA